MAAKAAKFCFVYNFTIFVYLLSREDWRNVVLDVIDFSCNRECRLIHSAHSYSQRLLGYP
jgi:hypothetical protein